MTEKEKVCSLLDAFGIPWERADHPPMHSVTDMLGSGLTERGCVARNLFLRDAKGRSHYLVVVKWDKAVDMRHLRGLLNSTRLSFASEARMMRYLGVHPGSVSPFGILNDASCAVRVYIDRELTLAPAIGVHPNDNTSTLYLAPEALLRVIREHGNPLEIIDL